jgi:hypothetical protein
MLTAQHDPDVIGELAEASTATADCPWRTFGDIGGNNGGYHANSNAANEPGEVQYFQPGLLRSSEARHSLEHAPNKIDNA